MVARPVRLTQARWWLSLDFRQRPERRAFDNDTVGTNADIKRRVRSDPKILSASAARSRSCPPLKQLQSVPRLAASRLPGSFAESSELRAGVGDSYSKQ